MVLGNLSCISKGATMIYPNETFDAEATLKQFLRKKQLPFMGTHDVFLPRHPDFKQYDLSSLRTGIMAGSLCPSELMRKVQTEMHLVEMEMVTA
jgi:fatty-acyl-CoA synthase